MTMHSKPTAADPLLWFGNTLIAIRVSAANGSDGSCVVEHWMPFGDGPPLHVHRTEDEIFHILAGELRFRIGENELVARTGETLLAPKGVPHTFKVDSSTGAHVLTITHGADFEAMLREASRPAVGPELPAFVEPTPKEIEQLVSACTRNGIEMVGPPLA